MTESNEPDQINQPDQPRQPESENTGEDLAADNDKSANKRLEQTEPEELVHALRQVFNGHDKQGPAKNTEKNKKVDHYKLNRKGQNLAADEPLSISSQAESKSGYTNLAALFADVFYGVLLAPRPTFLILSDGSKFPPNRGNVALTFALVLVALALPASIKLGAAQNPEEGTVKALAFIGGYLLNWSVLSFVLYYLSIFMRGNKLSLGNAFIVTGWAYLPFAFFAPVACFKQTLGSAFIFFACIPSVWFLVLQWLAFQTALRTSTIKLALLAIVVPPLFCFIYLFWVGLAVFSLLAQFISHLT